MNWQPKKDKDADRYLGLSGWLFDIAILGSLAAAAIVVWLVVFNADDFGVLGDDGSDAPAAGDSIVAQVSSPTPESSPLSSSPPEPTATVATSTDPPKVGPTTPPISAPTVEPTVAPTLHPEPEPTILPPVAQSPAPTSGPSVSVAQQAVAASAVKLETEVQSFRGVFDIETRLGGFRVGMTGQMLFEAPDSMYMVMDVLGDRLEILLDGPDMYMNIPGEGWRTVAQDIPGLDSDAYNDYLDNRGVVNYGQQLDDLANLEQLPDEEIDGVVYHHYAGDLDLESIISELPDEFVDDSQIDLALDIVGDLSMELWLDPDTLLPRRYVMTMAMEIDGESIITVVSMDFLEYNQPVDIPPPPVGAPPLLPPEVS